MNILYHLIEHFFRDEQTAIIIILLLSLVITIVQTTYISFITANIIESIEKSDISKSIHYFTQFVGVSVLFLVIYYFYKGYQNQILTKMTQWIKSEIFKIILLSNNENMKQVNFIEFITPITRISISFYVLFFDIITVIIPTLAFLVIIAAYFLYNFFPLGVFFALANICIGLYLWWVWDDLVQAKSKHEVKINENEKFIIDILNNIDKVIYRGQNREEIGKYESMTNEGIKSGIDFLTFTTNHVMIMTSIVYLILFLCVYYLIQSFFSKSNKVSPTIVVTCLAILLLYRDRMLGTIQNLPDYLEFIGRINYIIDDFSKMLGDKEDLTTQIRKEYSPQTLSFLHMQFKDVGFRYSDSQKKPVFDHLSLDITTDHKVIGITGLSGKGKSSFVKLMLRLYEPTTGQILIDGIDIATVDPNYLRANITYVNQTSKLFDKKVIYNIVYGCSNPDKCDEHLTEVMQYPKIRELFKNVDLHNANAGSLGENLSGGQRQVVNIISGLINPSKILILDEPTNALDADLKSDIIALIKHFRKYKNCVIIITHDRDVYQLFDETLQI